MNGEGLRRPGEREPGKAASVIVLATHGAPALDFPKDELAEFLTLQARLGHGGGGPPGLRRRHEELERRVRDWPRTAANDPFYAGSLELARELSRESGLEVFLGFNEFCSPGLVEALDRAAAAAARILVISPMLTRGGEHAAVDIPEAIRAARGRHPGKEFTYIWPFPTPAIARFLAGQLPTGPKPDE